MRGKGTASFKADATNETEDNICHRPVSLGAIVPMSRRRCQVNYTVAWNVGNNHHRTVLLLVPPK